jgi:hypothetical protein
METVKDVDQKIYAGVIVIFCLGIAAVLIGPNKEKPIEDIIAEEIIISSIDEVTALDIPESEPLPEIVFNDPILPRALPPLVEGGEVYFEEL